MLTLLLTDQRLSLSHDTISDLMTINVNYKLWFPNEKRSIIRSPAEAFEILKRHVDDPPAKVPRLDEEAESEDEVKSYSGFETSDIDELV